MNDLEMPPEEEPRTTYNPQGNASGLGCRVLAFLALALVAGGAVFFTITMIRLARSPIGNGGGGVLVLIAIIIAAVATCAGLAILFGKSK